MGKSEVARLPVAKQNGLNLYAPEETQPKMACENGKNSKSVLPTVLPPEMEVLTNQVAGHTNDGKSLGMLMGLLAVNLQFIALTCVWKPFNMNNSCFG